MARPIQADAERTRARVLEEAVRAFGRDGFRAATVRTIADAVGVTFATVHHYFGTKEALYGACIAEGYAQMMQVAAEVIAVLATPPVEDRVERAVCHAFRAARANRDRSRFMLRAFVFEDEALARAHIPTHRRELVESALAMLAANGAADATDLRVRLIGLGMLLTRFAVATDLERGFFGEDADEPGGAVERYLVQVATTTLAPFLPDPQPASA